jgi:tetratricopeptide (TPR) repeat protein
MDADVTTSTTFEPASSPSRAGYRPAKPGRVLGILFAAVVIAAGSYFATPPSSPADVPAPHANVPVPGDVGALTGLGPAPGVTVDGRLPIADRLTFWGDRVAARPRDFLSLVQLALVKAEQGRLSSDLEGYRQALTDIDRSLAIVPAYPPTIRARGSIRFALHDFSGALADARTVLEASPSDPAALALLGDAALELGSTDDAEAAYDRLGGLAPGPWLDIRRARLASVTGDADRALSLARRASEAAPSADPGEIGFYQYAVGEYARLSGDPVTARAGFEASFAARSSDIGALVGLARIDAFERRTDDAIANLRAAVAIAPQPESLSLLGDLLERSGDDAGAREAFETVRFIGRLGTLQGVVFDRQLLYFELDHGGATATVLDSAMASLAARPDASGHDMVAWALYRLGRLEEAAIEIDAARANGADGARLRFHDGAIALAQGDRARGLTLIESALADGPALDPRERAEAERLLAS